jgi:hypothetical protein
MSFKVFQLSQEQIFHFVASNEYIAERLVNGVKIKGIIFFAFQPYVSKIVIPQDVMYCIGHGQYMNAPSVVFKLCDPGPYAPLDVEHFFGPED